MGNRIRFYCSRYGLTGFLSVCILLLSLKKPVFAKTDSFSVMQWNRELQALETLGKKAGNEIGAERNVQSVTEHMPVSYDPRHRQLVTPVRDQQEWALCWDYAGIALMESALLKKGYGRADVDLSELHGAYAAYCLQADGSSFSQFCRRTNTRTALFEAALAGMGPVQEVEVPMRQITDDFALTERELCRQQYKVLSVRTQPLADTNACKMQILQTGGLMISYYSYGLYYRNRADGSGDSSYYFPYVTKSLNHTVEVVGWDDTYKAEHFVKMPQKDGAWLVKNSWGQKGYKGAGSGFYWISYEDGSLQKQLALSVQMSEKPVQDKLPEAESSRQEEEQEEEEKVISDPPPTWEERKECALWQMPVIEEIQPGRKHAVRDRLSMQRKLVNRF